MTLRSAGLVPPTTTVPVDAFRPNWVALLAARPFAVVPMNEPRTVRLPLPMTKTPLEKLEPMMPRTSRSALAPKIWRPEEDPFPRSSISGTALMAPVALVFGDEPGCV
jgi:hypothetical protein